MESCQPIKRLKDDDDDDDDDDDNNNNINNLVFLLAECAHLITHIILTSNKDYFSIKH